jgi:hypothetical protein
MRTVPAIRPLRSLVFDANRTKAPNPISRPPITPGIPPIFAHANNIAKTAVPASNSRKLNCLTRITWPITTVTHAAGRVIIQRLKTAAGHTTEAGSWDSKNCRNPHSGMDFVAFRAMTPTLVTAHHSHYGGFIALRQAWPPIDDHCQIGVNRTNHTRLCTGFCSALCRIWRFSLRILRPFESYRGT